MRTQGLLGRLAVCAFFGSSLAVVSCGDDDGGGGGDPATGGKASGGAGGRGGSTTGGFSTGGFSTGGVATGGTSPGGTAGEGAGAGPMPEAGTAGDAGGSDGSSGAPNMGGEAGLGGAGGQGGAPIIEGGTAGEDGGEGGQGGEGGAVALGDVYQIYVGCSDTSGTIQSYTLTRVGGTITPGPTYKAGSALTFGVLNADRDRLYVSHKSEGMITVFERDTTTGELDERSSVDVPYEPDDGSGGAGGTSSLNPGTQALAIDQTSSYLFAANFSASNVYTFELEGDGDVGDLVEEASDGTNPQHLLVNTSNRFLLAPYNGSDELAVYTIDDTDGSLTLTDPTLNLDAGTGPFHLAVHPSGDYVYSTNEDDGTITTYAFDDLDGAIDADETIDSPLPAGYTDDALPSEIVIDPDGQFAYVANRLEGGEEGAIVAFSIAQSGTGAGRLTPLATNAVVRSRGEVPRDIAISEDGAVLLAVNQDSDNLAVFNVNASGALGFVSSRAVCDQPYFIRIVTP